MVLGMGRAKKRHKDRKEEASVKKDTVLSSILEQLHKVERERREGGKELMVCTVVQPTFVYVFIEPGGRDSVQVI